MDIAYQLDSWPGVPKYKVLQMLPTHWWTEINGRTSTEPSSLKIPTTNAALESERRIYRCTWKYCVMRSHVKSRFANEKKRQLVRGSKKKVQSSRILSHSVSWTLSFPPLKVCKPIAKFTFISMELTLSPTSKKVLKHCLFVCLFVCLFACLFICLFVCLTKDPWDKSS